MIQWTASLQSLVIGALLSWAGAVKLRGLRPELVKRTALSRVVGERHASAAWRTVGGVELLVAAALLLPPAHLAEIAAAAGLTAGFLSYLCYARLAAPDSSCGCLSARLAPVSWRSFARAGLLLAMASYVLGVAAGTPVTDWYGAVAVAPGAAAGLVATELALLCACSSELDRFWLVPLRRLKVRLTHPLAGPSGHVPLAHTVSQLQVSEAYRQVGASIASDVQDSWDEGEWRIVCYAVRRDDGSTATAVFAVPLHRYDPDAVRFAVVDESRGEPAPVPA